MVEDVKPTGLAQAAYGAGIAFLALGLLFALICFLGHRRKLRKTIRMTARSLEEPITMDAVDGQSQVHVDSKKETPPPDYATATAMKKRSLLLRNKKQMKEMPIILPIPSADQFGTFSTHYITHTPTSGHEEEVMVVSGPISELR